MEPLTDKDIAKEFRKQLTKQDYAAKTKIAGVELFKLDLFADEGGYLTVITQFINDRLKNWPDFAIKQINFAAMQPGVIKATHVHFKQEDIWFVPPSDSLVVGLLDVRENSATKGQVMRLALGCGQAKLLFIPRGVAHGAANLGGQPAHILYFVNNSFDPSPENNDEHRLPWHIFGKNFWELAKE